MASSEFEYLDSERKKIWKEIIELQDQVKKKTPDYEDEARQASRKCSEYKNKCEATKNEAQAQLELVHELTSEINSSDTPKIISEIKTFHNEIEIRKASILQQATELENLFGTYATLSDKLRKLQEIADSAQDSSTKVETIHKQLLTKKKEIDEVHLEIFGYTQENEEGEDIEVAGLKEELDQAYNQLRNDFETFATNKTREFATTLNGWKEEYIAVRDSVEELLPKAMTAGLSAAYSEKKDAEITESGELQKIFFWSVVGLVVVSLIPFLVSIYMMLYKGMPIEESILKLPRLVFSIFPLYIPILWVAYSANRKLNLSKRLIEEYTHKEVLSKTFEGLSKQIEKIEDTDTSNELRTRLLYNILEVSSENPGKLISDYNKSDHPLMDALDKSVKLTSAIEHLAKVPGMTKLVSVLETKSKDVLEKEEKKAVAGLEKVEPQTDA